MRPRSSVWLIGAAREKVEQAAHKLAEEMYKASQQAAGDQAGPEAAGPSPGADAAGQTEGAGQEGAVDADFEVVDDDKK